MYYSGNIMNEVMRVLSNIELHIPCRHLLHNELYDDEYE